MTTYHRASQREICQSKRKNSKVKKAIKLLATMVVVGGVYIGFKVLMSRDRKKYNRKPIMLDSFYNDSSQSSVGSRFKRRIPKDRMPVNKTKNIREISTGGYYSSPERNEANVRSTQPLKRSHSWDELYSSKIKEKAQRLKDRLKRRSPMLKVGEVARESKSNPSSSTFQ